MNKVNRTRKHSEGNNFMANQVKFQQQIGIQCLKSIDGFTKESQKKQISTPDQFVNKIQQIGLQIVHTMENVNCPLAEFQMPALRLEKIISFGLSQDYQCQNLIQPSLKKSQDCQSVKLAQKLKDQLQKIKALYISFKISQNKSQQKCRQGMEVIKQKFHDVCKQNGKLIQQNKKLKRKVELDAKRIQEFISKSDDLNMKKQVRKINQQVEELKNGIKTYFLKIQEKDEEIRGLKLQLEASRKSTKNILFQSRKKTLTIIKLKQQLKKRAVLQEQLSDQSIENSYSLSNTAQNEIQANEKNFLNLNFNQGKSMMSNSSTNISKKAKFSDKNFLTVENNRTHYYSNQKNISKISPRCQTKDIDCRLNQLIASMTQEISTINSRNKNI